MWTFQTMAPIDRSSSVHPSHLHIVAALLLTAETPWLRYKGFREARIAEHARALAILCPDMSVEVVIEKTRPKASDWENVDVSKVVRGAREEEPRRVPRRQGLLATFLRLWRRPSRTCSRESCWLMPWELRDVWPRIFAELVSREQGFYTENRRARVDGILNVLDDGHEVTILNLAQVLRCGKDLGALKQAIDAPPQVWDGLAQQMGLPMTAARCPAHRPSLFDWAAGPDQVVSAVHPGTRSSRGG